MNRTLPALIVAVLAAAWPDGAALHAARAAGQQPARVRIAAASDLKFALDEIVARFVARHPAIRVEPTYGSSGNFHAQLRQRAPFDLFLSADMEYVRDLVARGIGTEPEIFPYAIGHLVLWVPARSPLRVEEEGLAALRGARRIAIANPRHAPYGRAAEAALRAGGLWEEVQPRLVLGESIAQTAQFARSGAVDAVLVSRSLAAAPAMSGSGRFRDVPPGTYPPILQGGLILPWTASRPAAEQFRSFLTGPDGRSVLARHGFALPE